MKKVLAFTLSVILAGTTLTGCGKSTDELTEIAEQMQKSGNIALSALDERETPRCFSGTGTGKVFLDSNGNIMGSSPIGKFESMELFTDKFKKEFKDLDDYYWIAEISQREIKAIYVAESENGKIGFSGINSFSPYNMHMDEFRDEIWHD